MIWFLPKAQLCSQFCRHLKKTKQKNLTFSNLLRLNKLLQLQRETNYKDIEYIYPTILKLIHNIKCKMQSDFIENYSRPVYDNQNDWQLVKGYGRYQGPLLDFSLAFDLNDRKLLGDKVLWLWSYDCSILHNSTTHLHQYLSTVACTVIWTYCFPPLTNYIP